MRIQLWSYNYDPEPMGIGPVSTVWARAMSARGHEVEVVAAHPHYPEPAWGRRYLPYREIRDGIPLTRLPIAVGRDGKFQRIAQELSYMTAQAIASPFLGTPDVLISVSPSFPALLPAIFNQRMRRIPWVLWLQDILPDGAATTGYLGDEGSVYRLSRRLESKAYQSASRIVVLSESFRSNLIGKGVPAEKISLAYNPATMEAEGPRESGNPPNSSPRIICMGNIGRSQGLAPIVEAFEDQARLEELDARFVITGTGVEENEVRSSIRSGRVEMMGVVDRQVLQAELSKAALGAVTQSYGGGDFNVPSKLMNYLALGLPVIASLPEGSEAARIIQSTGSGWVTDSNTPEDFAATAADALSDPEEMERRGRLGLKFAQSNLTPMALAEKFDAVLDSV